MILCIDHVLREPLLYRSLDFQQRRMVSHAPYLEVLQPGMEPQ